jgi:hypothetical protein
MSGYSTTRRIFDEAFQEGFFRLRSEGNGGMGRSIVHNAWTSSSVVERGEAAIDVTPPVEDRRLSVLVSTGGVRPAS